MPIIPSGGAYPGIINEATLLADAAAAVAAAKATAVPDASAVAAAKAAAVPDAATIAALVEPAQGHAAAVAALVAPVQADAATVAALVSPAQADAGAVSAAKNAAQAAAVSAVEFAGSAEGSATLAESSAADASAYKATAQADAAATLAAKEAANLAYGAITGIPLRVDAAQSLTEGQKVQGRANLGVLDFRSIAAPATNNPAAGLSGWGAFSSFTSASGSWSVSASTQAAMGWRLVPFFIPTGATVSISLNITAVTDSVTFLLWSSAGASVSNSLTFSSTGSKTGTLTATGSAAYLMMISGYGGVSSSSAITGLTIVPSVISL